MEIDIRTVVENPPSIRFSDSILELCSLEGDVEYPAGRECGHNILLGDAEDGVIALLHKFVKEVNNCHEED